MKLSLILAIPNFFFNNFQIFFNVYTLEVEIEKIEIVIKKGSWRGLL